MAHDFDAVSAACEAFCARVAVPDAARGELSEALVRLAATGREAWPGVEVPLPAFATYLAERVPGDVGPGEGLASLCATDLYLACACARGDAAAARGFQRTYRRTIEMAVAALGEGALADEVHQRLGEKLLVGSDGTPRITSYSGRGELRSWVRAAALRECLSLLRVRRREVPVERPMLEVVADPHDDPELAHLKRLYRAEFREAFAAALAALSPRDRTLLRFKFLDGASVDEIGRIYQVHRATAARWVAEVREQLFLSTRDRLVARLQLQPSQFDSILRLIRSRLDVSITEHLRSADA